MKRGAIIGVALLVAGAFAGAWWLRGTSASDLAFSGTIESPVVSVGSLPGGRVRSVAVEEGQRVSTGEALGKRID